jgi:hypothetical protein
LEAPACAEGRQYFGVGAIVFFVYVNSCVCVSLSMCVSFQLYVQLIVPVQLVTSYYYIVVNAYELYVL